MNIRLNGIRAQHISPSEARCVGEQLDMCVFSDRQGRKPSQISRRASAQSHFSELETSLQVAKSDWREKQLG